MQSITIIKLMQMSFCCRPASLGDGQPTNGSMYSAMLLRSRQTHQRSIYSHEVGHHFVNIRHVPFKNATAQFQFICVLQETR